MVLHRGGDGAGGHCCSSMRVLSCRITVLYATMVLSFMLMFHSPLVDADMHVIRNSGKLEGTHFPDAESLFGEKISPQDGITGNVVYANPEDGCSALDTPPKVENYTGKWFVLIKGNGCDFVDKVWNAERAGFDLAIVHNVNSSDIEPMSGEDLNDITIPSVFTGEVEGLLIKEKFLYDMGFYIFIDGGPPFTFSQALLGFAMLCGIGFTVKFIFEIIVRVFGGLVRCCDSPPLPRSTTTKRLPLLKFDKNDPSNTFETCAICLEDYRDGDKYRVLHCGHAFHCKCIDRWLRCSYPVCPLCKCGVNALLEINPSGDDDDSTQSQEIFLSALEPEGETTPLIGGGTSQPRCSQRGRPRGGGTFQPQRENPFVRASSLPNLTTCHNRPEPDTSSEYPTTSDSSCGENSPLLVSASSEESLAQVVTNPELENLVDAGPSSSSPRMSVNSSRDEVQEVAVVPQAEPQAGGRSWWSSLWSRSVDA
ncbi:E3 ubiquitin-protein ligase RNF13-like isoform X2 [Ischnura elegans]|uniref:E3 ubiquitin-protein ligase RNF13-like isoform X2 n=1 Tax=Ischnura elegans TaxID=197161 RepID=UPI001ED880D8|nr:E3 ubiquitin-protein ligase RNF13-like isoform X2 [Ischnura elegans]